MQLIITLELEPCSSGLVRDSETFRLWFSLTHLAASEFTNFGFELHRSLVFQLDWFLQLGKFSRDSICKYCSTV